MRSRNDVDGHQLADATGGRRAGVGRRFHGGHVMVGVIWLLSLGLLSLRGRLPVTDAVKLEVAGLYWHFVDIVWIVIFTLVYLIP